MHFSKTGACHVQLFLSRILPPVGTYTFFSGLFFFGRYVRKGVRVQINLDTINFLGFPEKIENRTVTFLQGRVVGGFFVCKHVAKLWVGGCLCKYGFVQIYRFFQKWPQIFINIYKSTCQGWSLQTRVCLRVQIYVQPDSIRCKYLSTCQGLLSGWVGVWAKYKNVMRHETRVITFPLPNHKKIHLRWM